MNKINNLWMWGGIGLVLMGSLYLFQGILLPFFTGLLVAYAMSSAVRSLEKWGISRTFAALFIIILFFLSIVLLLVIALPFLQTELFYLASRIPQYGARLMLFLQPFLEKVTHYMQSDDSERLKALASTHLGDFVTWGIRLIAGILTKSLALANILSLIVITPVVAFYCLRDWEKLITTLDRWLPRPYEPTLRYLFSEMNATISGFAKGQSLVCLTVGFYYCLTLTLADLDFSLIVGVIIGITAFIPYVGALLGFMLSLGIALSQFPDWGSIGVIVAIFLVGQTLEGYFFIPYFVGDRIKLHPVWIIFALFGGGVLYGFLGILFALPVAAAIGVLMRHGIQIYLKSPYYLGNKVLSSRKKVS